MILGQAKVVSERSKALAMVSMQPIDCPNREEHCRTKFRSGFRFYSSEKRVGNLSQSRVGPKHARLIRPHGRKSACEVL